MFQATHLIGFGARRAAAAAGYAANAVVFDGTNDYMSRGAELTGIADGKAGTFSCWIKSNTDGTLQSILGNASQYFSIEKRTDNKIRIDIYTSGLSNILRMETSAIVIADGWTHIMASWDLNASATNMYVDGATNKTLLVGPTNSTIDYTRGNWLFGSRDAGASKISMDIAEAWFTTTYLDLSVADNRAKFLSAGKPVSLGSDGSTPTSVAPLVYFNNPSASFQTNKGSGGDFTVTGALTTAATSPSD
jgi:hypothetical protein